MNNDIFTGVHTARKVIAELNATDYTFVDGNKMNHFDSIVAFDSRCYTTNAILSRFKKLEDDRDDAHKQYRAKVDAFIKNLPFEDGCPRSNRYL